jgi:hypothetical protein
LVSRDLLCWLLGRSNGKCSNRVPILLYGLADSTQNGSAYSMPAFAFEMIKRIATIFVSVMNVFD